MEQRGPNGPKLLMEHKVAISCLLSDESFILCMCISTDVDVRMRMVSQNPAYHFITAHLSEQAKGQTHHLIIRVIKVRITLITGTITEI